MPAARALAGSNRPARGQRKHIAAAGYAVGQRERGNFQRVYVEWFLCDLPAHRVRLRPGQCRDGLRHRLDALGAVDHQRLGAVQAAQGLQKTGQAQNVVAVVVGQQHRRKPIRADAVPPQADLRALAAVQQHAAPAHRDRGGGQCAVRQRLRAARAQQGYFQHVCTSFPILPHYQAYYSTNRAGGKGAGLRWSPVCGMRRKLCPHQPPAGGSFSLRAKSRRKKRRLRSDTRLRAQPRGGSQKKLKHSPQFLSYNLL